MPPAMKLLIQETGRTKPTTDCSLLNSFTITGASRLTTSHGTISTVITTDTSRGQELSSAVADVHVSGHGSDVAATNWSDPFLAGYLVRIWR